jgi:hypothetical protein
VVRINMMCLLGVLLGLLCLTVPVLTETTTLRFTGAAIEHHQYMTTHQYVNLVFAPIAFFLGVALAFVTPLGGVGTASGMIGYYYGLSPKFDTSGFLFPAGITMAYHWGAAFYIGILATIVTLVSFVFPIGPGYSEMYSPWPQGRGNLKERLLVWGRGRKPRGGA